MYDIRRKEAVDAKGAAVGETEDVVEVAVEEGVVDEKEIKATRSCN